MCSSGPPTPAGQKGAPGHPPARGTFARALVTLTATLTLALIGASAARAGEWVQVSCINPNQTAAGSGGWSSFSAGAGFGSNVSSQCGPGASAYALLSSDAAAPVGAHETLQYTAPAGSTLTGGLLDIGMYADGHGYNASGTAVAYTPEYAYDGSNVFFQCAAGLQPCSGFSNEYVGQLDLPGGRSGDLYLEAGCGGSAGYSCDEGALDGAWSEIQLWWANLRLTNDATPGASNIAGTLLSSEDRGERELVLTATDPEGPGVYDVTVQADGATLYSGTPDSNNGQCVAAGESNGALMFDASQPCKQTENIDLPIDTTVLHDGQHTLKVTVSDAAANSAVVYDNTIATDNAPLNSSVPTVSGGEAPKPADTLSAQHGEWAAPEHTGSITYSYQWQDCNAYGDECQTIRGAEGATYTTTNSDVGHTLRAQVTAADNDGSSRTQSEPTDAVSAPPAPTPEPTPTPGSNNATASTTTVLASPTQAASILGAGAPTAQPNGAAASENAQIHLSTPARLTRSYAERAFTIGGRLTTAGGQPISGATLDVSEQVTGGLASGAMREGVTSAEGTFTIHVPAGASRTITLAYRAYSTDLEFAARASVQETVAAGVQLRITPRRTSPTGTITIEGRVQRPLAPDGVLVELLVHYRGQWVPFRDPRTNSSGRFKATYQFQGGEGRFPFRAMIPAGQAGYPYGAGYSNPITVRSG